ncbi:hypothetical protein HB778_14630 [Mesorhizobium huakuii]|uniref:Uncharacterized protein n=1 Tax=Mesorhizobium huakuii TaxID=28104 RepID=A0A7G6ST73_9HYPH|nr:hypothetical protein HB778_14630 [Mesorhizobium huakuii]
MNFSYLQFCQMSGESMRRLMQDQAYPGANECGGSDKEGQEQGLSGMRVAGDIANRIFMIQRNPPLRQKILYPSATAFAITDAGARLQPKGGVP